VHVGTPSGLHNLENLAQLVLATQGGLERGVQTETETETETEAETAYMCAALAAQQAETQIGRAREAAGVQMATPAGAEMERGMETGDEI